MKEEETKILDGQESPGEVLGDSEVKPAQVLVNYFALVDDYFTKEELLASMYEISRRLRDRYGLSVLADFEHQGTGDLGIRSVRDEIASKAFSEEFQYWVSQDLVRWDRGKGVWKIPRRLREIYDSVAPAASRGMSPLAMRYLRDTITEVGVVKLTLHHPVG